MAGDGTRLDAGIASQGALAPNNTGNAQEELHVQLDRGINRLSEIETRLDDLRNRIDPSPRDQDSPEKACREVPSLRDLMVYGPERIEHSIRRMHEQINELQQLIFNK